MGGAEDVVAEGAVPVLLEYPSVRPVPYPIEEEREERKFCLVLRELRELRKCTDHRQRYSSGNQN